MIRIGLNGLGRIGRAVFRIANMFDDIQIVAINDINPEIENLAYLLRFDSYYGRSNFDIQIDNEIMICDGNKINVTHEKKISDVNWAKYECDVVIEAAGAHFNLDFLPEIIESGVKKIIVTYSSDKVDHTIVLGANEETYDAEKHNIISSSICDAVAFAPVYRILNNSFGIDSGFLTTLHPWLSYQNLLDGPPQSWGYPGQLYAHYSLGRASTASIILKPTSAIEASNKVLPGILEKIKCYSYRVPIPVVGAADITFQLNRQGSKEDVLNIIHEFQKQQNWPILHTNADPLVSVDFIGTDYSAVIDTRWFEIINGSLIKMSLWYDNEWGYSRRVVDIVRFLFELEPRMHAHEENSLS